MKLILKRIALRDTYTIGKLYIDGVYFCDTLEDKVRDLNKNGKFDNGEKFVFSAIFEFGSYDCPPLHTGRNIVYTISPDQLLVELFSIFITFIHGFSLYSHA
jgi:hypothetical protein